MKGTAESVRADTHIYDSTAVITIILVESKLPSVMHAIQPICILWLRIRKLVDHILNMRNRALETLINLAERALYIWNLALALEAFTLEDDLASVRIGISD
jgi:hypothetical protein